MRILIKNPDEIINPNPHPATVNDDIRRIWFDKGKQAILDACVEVDIDKIANGWFDYEANCENISCASHKTFSQFLQEELNQPDCYADGSKIPKVLPF